MDNNYGYLDQEVEQFAAYVDTLQEARRNDTMASAAAPPSCW